MTEGNYLLENLIATQGLDDPRVVTPAEYESMLGDGTAGDFDVTVFDAYAPPSLPAAGTFVWSGVLPPGEASGIAAVTDEAGVELFYEGNAVLDWERDHPMLRGLNLNRVYAAEGRVVTLPVGATMLIEGDRGPMLVLERSGPRTHLIFTFDLTRSNWPLLKTFPAFGVFMFEYLAAGEDVTVRESVRPGEPVGVPRSLVERADLSPGDEVGVISIDGDRRATTVDESGGVTLGPFDEVGVYRTDPPIPRFERVAVSLLDATESNVLPAATDPGNLGGRDLAEPASGGLAEGLRNVEWWWWLVAAAAGMLLVEWFVYTRRVAA